MTKKSRQRFFGGWGEGQWGLNLIPPTSYFKKKTNLKSNINKKFINLLSNLFKVG